MIKTDEDALVCDLAETYHVYDYKALPVNLVATLSAGLREDSRIKMKMADIKYNFQTLLLASILDGINLRNWLETEREEDTRPESMVNILLGKEKQTFDEKETFISAEEFKQKRKELIEKGRRKCKE